MATTQPAAAPAVRTKQKYEFFGPPGAFVISTSISLLTYLSHFFITASPSVPPPQFLSAPIESLKAAFTSPETPLFSLNVLLAYVAYFLGLVLLQHILPGPYVQGVLLPDGKTRLTYKLNAIHTSIFILSVCAYGTYFHGGANWVLWTWLWENNLALITSLNIFTLSLSAFLYLNSHRTNKASPVVLARGGQTGNFLYDWYIGRELNPRTSLLPSFDLKEFCELRPGLILWMILNLSNIAAQIRLHPTTSTTPILSPDGKYVFGISTTIILTTLFQIWYVIDSHIHEPAVLTTMDIVTDGFGHMLVFGDLLWVPFMYSLQTRYLAFHPTPLHPLHLAIILCVHLSGYTIFRLSNSQKNLFRTNPTHPSIAHLESIKTRRGTRLLVSGWWGVARHVNYLGDWVMAWAWCLTTGTGGGWGVTYFYVVYFGILLVHRERRDDEACEEKYGEDWRRYTRLVRWRILPGVY
ncbi:Delta(14)-sterol reductase [Peziza echinospora]|nr:Delta(14)-sterol reductase [Peziza echinospora]